MVYFSASVLLLCIVFYTFYGYRLILKIGVRLASASSETEKFNASSNTQQRVTILLTVHNEEDVIGNRLDNLLTQDYRPDLLNILVVSDHSNDGTEGIVRSYCKDNSNIELYLAQNEIGGKTAAQNEAIPRIQSDLLIFTDANISFEPDFVSEVVKSFEDQDVGAVDGRLIFQKSDGSISESQGHYWSYELDLRELESRLGLMAVSSGATLGIRRHLFREMANWVGEDCIVPLDIIQQGYRVVHNKNALAYETAPKDFSSELKARVRMTLRNWQGTWAYSSLLNPCRNFRYSFSLWSHKLLRWLTPYFIVGSFVFSVLGAMDGFLLNWFLLSFFLLSFLSAALGTLNFVARSFPPARHAYSFIAANIGFAIGVYRALNGTKVHRF